MRGTIFANVFQFLDNLTDINDGEEFERYWKEITFLNWKDWTGKDNLYNVSHLLHYGLVGSKVLVPWNVFNVTVRSHVLTSMGYIKLKKIKSKKIEKHIKYVKIIILNKHGFVDGLLILTSLAINKLYIKNKNMMNQIIGFDDLNISCLGQRFFLV